MLKARRILAMGIVGIMVCGAAVYARKALKPPPPIPGDWIGSAGHGADKSAPTDDVNYNFPITFKADGTFSDDASFETGTWKTTSEGVLLEPSLFHGMTREQTSARWTVKGKLPTSREKFIDKAFATRKLERDGDFLHDVDGAVWYRKNG